MNVQGFEMPGLTAVTEDELSGIEGGGFFGDLKNLGKDVLNTAGDVIKTAADVIKGVGTIVHTAGAGVGAAGSGLKHLAAL